MSLGDGDGVPGRHGVGSSVGCHGWLGGGVFIPLHVQRVWRLTAVPFGQGRPPSV